MLVPFGTRVVDAEGKAVGTVRYIVLHPDTRQVDGLVVHQGVIRSRELIVPIGKIANAGGAIQLTLGASDLGTLLPFHPQHLRPMPDHWDMPAGFDERAFFLWAGGPGPKPPCRSCRPLRPRRAHRRLSRTRIARRILMSPRSPSGRRSMTAWANISVTSNR